MNTILQGLEVAQATVTERWPYKSIQIHTLMWRIPLRAVGLEGLLSRLQFWPPGLIKAPIRAGVEKNEPVHKKTPRDTNCQKKSPLIIVSPIVPSLTLFFQGSLGNICQKGDKKHSRVQEADFDLNLDVEAANRF